MPVGHARRLGRPMERSRRSARTGAGLVVIRPNNLETYSPPDKWNGCPVLSVLPAPDGALWIGTEGAGLYRLQNGDWTNFYLAQGIRNPYVWALAADGAGKIWAATWGGR